MDLIDHRMGKECDALGFKIDCGHAFSEKYGQAATDYEELDRIINDVTDISLLGAAIYSQWRYFNQWAYTGTEISEPQNREWFVLAFGRLAQISKKDPFIFQGTLKKVCIISNNICNGAMPEQYDEVEQHLTINNEGVTKIKSGIRSEGADLKSVTWNYTEHLIIDRETETIEHIQNIGAGCRVSRKYEIENGIESLLDNFDAEGLFTNIKGNPDDVIDIPNETRDYKITINYKKNPQRIIEGSYDKNGLPEDFANFAMTVLDFIRFYGLGEILDPSVYRKVKRRKSEYIFCSVIFSGGYKSYYYLTDDDSIEVGDFVLVPAGKDNHEVIVEVVDVEYFSEENVPLPIEKTKKIIRKCMEEDFDTSVKQV